MVREGRAILQNSVSIDTQLGSDNPQVSRCVKPRFFYLNVINNFSGMTLDKIIVHLGETEFASGLTYTATTRERRGIDIAFSPYPNFIR